ncbi:MAG TPA: SAM-dependent methyltransferase [Bacteroidetes bacterium]|nr:SAM-dependent methyltransferase [Bacteroidota bacterium]
MMNKQGKLYLIPTPLGENGLHAIPAYVVNLIHKIEYVVAERAKTARHFIKATGTPRPMPSYHVSELNARSPQGGLGEMLQPVFDGKDVGIMSEAGCPGVADPGARLVALAHRKGVEVVPMSGPSSILLALMASGLNGQNFCFHGYLPAKVNDLATALKKLGQAAKRQNQTQLFIEAPYRNRQVVEQALKVLSPETLFCIAVDLTLETEFVLTKKIGEWRKGGTPELHKRPAMFLVGNAP